MDSHHHHDHDHDHYYHEHEHSVMGELMHHLPYAIFSVAFALIILSFVTLTFRTMADATMAKKGAKMLFHSFHFMHIVFAATGTLITFRRFSKNFIASLFVGIVSPIIFCTLSDSVLPYLGARALGVDIDFHLCFHKEMLNVIPFLLVGVINGFVMSAHHAMHQKMYSIFSHFVHIFISSLAATFYLVAHGYGDWYKDIGLVFLFIIVAVVIPCTLSDVVVPMSLARVKKKS